ncbi:MAG: hypothetical protein AAF391_00780 [Bacteroidota bacterium]
METNRTTLIIALASALLVILSFFSFLNSGAQDFLVGSSEKLLESLTIVTELKIAAHTGSSSHIPIVSGMAKGLGDSLDRVFNYLLLSNALITSQIIILNLSKSFLFKLIAFACIGGLFFKRFHSISYKALIICLMINPGLLLYVSALNYMSQEAKLDLGVSLQKELAATHEKYQAKEQERKQKRSERDQKQLEKAKEQGKDKIGLLDQIEDKVGDTISDTSNKIGEEFQYSLDVIKVGGKKLVQMVVNTMVTIIVVFLVLPIVYLYLINLALKRLFNIQLNKQVAENVANEIGSEWSGDAPTSKPTKK